MEATTRRALRGTIRLRWWRRHGMSVAIATIAILSVWIICNIVKIANDLNMSKAASYKPETITKVVTRETEPTIIVETSDDCTEKIDSASSNNVQQYMAEQIEVNEVNYYSSRVVTTEYCTNVVNSAAISEPEVYTYLGRTYDEEDVMNIARIAWFEQGICGKDMTQLAAAVLINRSHWTEFGSTYLECFYQDGQYSTYTIERYESSEEIPDEVYDWIVELLSGESQYGEVPVTVVFQAQFPQGIDTYATASNTYICYADENLLGEYIP